MADETTNPTDTADQIEAALEKGVDVDSPEITEKLEKLKRALGVSDTPAAGQPLSPNGSDVDWSEYDLPTHLAHLYPKARQEVTPEGLRWLVDVVEFIAIKERYEKIGQTVTQMVNGPEGWRLQSAVVPVNSNTGVATLQRIFPVALPTPNMLKSEEDVVAAVSQPSEDELAAMEKQALAWAGGEGEAPAPPATPAIATLPGNALTDVLEERKAEYEEAREEFQPSRANVIPGAVAASKEFHEARERE